MKRHLSSLLIVSTVLVAACQPSQGAIQTAGAQTQAVQAAFNAAVAGAQTQAAFEAAVGGAQSRAAAPLTPAATMEAATALPAVTVSPETQALKNHLDGSVQAFRPNDGSKLEAHVLSLVFQTYDNGNAAVMDLLLQKSDDTKESAVYAAVTTGFLDLYKKPANAGLLNAIPANLKVFRIHICDPSRLIRWRLTGNWQDLMLYANGSLTADEFSDRLQFEQAAE